MIFVLAIVAVVIGTLMPFQAGINAELTRAIRHPYLGAFISFLTGTVVLGIIVLIQGQAVESIKRLSSQPPYLFLGGALGALFVGSSIFLIPKMGATAMIAAFVTGQLLMSVAMDHYGVLGLPVQTISTTRLLGVILLFIGIYMVLKKA